MYFEYVFITRFYITLKNFPDNWTDFFFLKRVFQKDEG